MIKAPKEMGKIHKIYVVTNAVNGKMYVGMTSRKIRKRWREHKVTARKTERDHYFARALRKHGDQNFFVEVVGIAFSRDRACQMEKDWIQALRTAEGEIGYNTTLGGEGATHTAEVREKMSKAKKGKPLGKLTEEQKAARRLLMAGRPGPNKGRKFSEKSKKKMSESRTGEGNPWFGVRGAKHWKFGVPQSEEAKRKQSEALRGEKHPMYGRRGPLNPIFGRKRTPEEIKKSADSRTGLPSPLKGIPRSPETKAKISATKQRKKSELLLLAS